MNEFTAYTLYKSDSIARNELKERVRPSLMLREQFTYQDRLLIPGHQWEQRAVFEDQLRRLLRRLNLQWIPFYQQSHGLEWVQWQETCRERNK